MSEKVDEPNAGRSQFILIVLLFAGTMLSYVDRQVLALLKPTLVEAFHWSDQEFAHLGSAFSLATAFFVLFAGWLIDRFGVRATYGWAVSLWSAAGMAHAFAASVTQFVGARIVLALGETVAGPATVKAMAENLTQKQRSLGLGIVNTAPSLGAITAPLIIPPLALLFGWKAAFLITGGLGFVWVLAWFLGARHLKSTPVLIPEPSGKINWFSVFADRRTWAITGAKALADMVWWFMLFWVPDLFSKVFHLTQAQIGGPVAVTYAMGAAGALASGFLFPALMRLGLSTNAGRKFSMLIFACLILPLPLALQMPTPWLAAGIVGLALFAHNGFVTNIFGLTADIVPLHRVATVIAIGSVAGNISGTGMIEFAGWSLTNGHGYWPMFAISSVAYLLATGFLHLMAPALKARDETQ